MKIDGVEGESRDARHAREIDVLPFSWGESNAGATGGGDVVGLSALPKVVEVPGGVDAVPVDQPVAVAGDGFIKFTLTDLLVSSYKTSAGPQPHLSTDQTPAAGGADLPTDAVALKFARIELEVQVQRADGSLGSSVKAGFDRKKGTKT